MIITLWSVPGRSADEAGRNALSVIRDHGFERAGLLDIKDAGDARYHVDLEVVTDLDLPPSYPPATELRPR